MAERGRIPGAYTQTLRVLRMLDALQRKPIGYQLGDLAVELKVTTRTIRRDTDVLLAAGFAIEVADAQVRLLPPRPR